MRAFSVTRIDNPLTEQVNIGFERSERDAVSALLALQVNGRSEKTPKIRHIRAERPHGAIGRIVTPYRLDEAPDADGLTSMEDKICKERTLLQAPERDQGPIDNKFERPEQSEHV